MNDQKLSPENKILIENHVRTMIQRYIVIVSLVAAAFGALMSYALNSTAKYHARMAADDEIKRIDSQMEQLEKQAVEYKYQIISKEKEFEQTLLASSLHAQEVIRNATAEAKNNIDGILDQAIKLGKRTQNLQTNLDTFDKMINAGVSHITNDENFMKRLTERVKPIPVGTILAWPAKDIPRGWLACDGRALSSTAQRNRYEKLFEEIGTYWGDGLLEEISSDSETNFNIPNIGNFSPQIIEIEASENSKLIERPVIRYIIKAEMEPAKIAVRRKKRVAVRKKTTDEAAE